MIPSFLYTSKLRRLARALGITWLLQYPARRRGAQRRKAAEALIGQIDSVTVNGITVQAKITDPAIYQRLHSLTDDAHLVGALRERAGPEAVIWDIGANLGLYSVLLAKALGRGTRVFAFEPEPRIRAAIEEVSALNGLDSLTPMAMALGRENGTARLSMASEGASGVHSLVHEVGHDSLEVSLRRGDDVIAAGEAPLPSVVKIDVEGFEEEVVDGLAASLAQPDLRLVLCEMHFRLLAERGEPDAPQRICAKLAEAGLTRQEWLDPSHLLASRP